MNKVVLYIVVFGLQVFVFNHLNFTSYLVPQVYIILLIILPVHLRKLNLYLLAFGLGLVADFFVSTPGIHASGALWMMAIRNVILSRLDITQQKANRMWFTSNTVGLAPFLYTTLSLVFFYHFYVLFIESIGAFNPVRWLLTVLASSTFALLFIWFLELVYFGRLND